MGNEFPVLTATPKANDVLFGGSSVMLRQAEEKTAERRRDTGDAGLLDVLKALRRKIADEKRVPAYVVFPDATLSDMCKKLPKTREALLAVSGVGKTKLEQYGERVLNAIRDYEIGAGETPREKTSFEPRESAASPRRGRAWSVKEERTLAELLRKGAPLTEMAKTLKRSEGGVCARLKRLGLIEDRSDLS